MRRLKQEAGLNQPGIRNCYNDGGKTGFPAKTYGSKLKRNRRIDHRVVLRLIAGRINDRRPIQAQTQVLSEAQPRTDDGAGGGVL